MSSLHGHNSRLHNHEPKSISSIEEFFEGFLRHFQVCPILRIQEEAFIEHHHHLGNLDDGQERGSSLGPHDKNRHDDNPERSCDREGESIESEVKVNPTFSKDTLSDDLPFEDLGEGDPIVPLMIDINDYLLIQEGKWEVRFDKDPIYDTNDRDIHRTLVFHHNHRVVVESHVDPF